MKSRDPILRMRCTLPSKYQLLIQTGYSDTRHSRAPRNGEQKEVRWHSAQMLPRLRLKSNQVERAVALLLRCLDDDSRIVRLCALQAFTDVAKDHPTLRARASRLLRRLRLSDIPSVLGRANSLKRLLKSAVAQTLIDRESRGTARREFRFWEYRSRSPAGAFTLRGGVAAHAMRAREAARAASKRGAQAGTVPPAQAANWALRRLRAAHAATRSRDCRRVR